MEKSSLVGYKARFQVSKSVFGFSLAQKLTEEIEFKKKQVYPKKCFTKKTVKKTGKTPYDKLIAFLILYEMCKFQQDRMIIKKRSKTWYGPLNLTLNSTRKSYH